MKSCRFFLKIYINWLVKKLEMCKNCLSSPKIASLGCRTGLSLYHCLWNLRIFEDAFQFVRPDDDALISRTRRKSFPIFSVSHTVHCISMSLQWLDKRTVIRVIYQDSVTSGNYELRPIRVEAHFPDTGSKDNIHKYDTISFLTYWPLGDVHMM